MAAIDSSVSEAETVYGLTFRRARVATEARRAEGAAAGNVRVDEEVPRS